MSLFVLFSLFIGLSCLNCSRKFDPCKGRATISQPIIDFCTEVNGTLTFRCCLLEAPLTILAIDMINMSLTEVPNIADFQNINISVIDLRLNPNLKPSSDDFLKLTTLESLYVPDTFPCPGGNRVWEYNNSTVDLNGTLCNKQKDFCFNRTDVCVIKDSDCHVNGPDHHLCLCKEGYHGYKCLRQGSFPTAIFLGATFAVTVLSSGFLYWTQRRHVRK